MCKERLFLEQSADTQDTSIFNKIDIKLSNLNLLIKPGSKVCIMGLEKSGIDELVKALTEELEHIGGRFYKHGEISCLDLDQSNIFQTSIRENIILTSRYDKKKFQRVLEIVGFSTKKFFGGEMYIFNKIEDVSPMNKIKILLARLIYQDSDIYIIHNLFKCVTKLIALKIFTKVIK